MSRPGEKIPTADSDIKVCHTVCDICCPSFHCGIDAYVKDGRVIKIEGMNSHPASHGRLCTKGLMNRQYLYSEKRIRTPLKRVGPRGSGRFEPISWEEAYAEIAQRLTAIKNTWGPEAVMFQSGYTKWYRPFLHRLANRFGTPNYGTESSSCMYSTFLNWLVTTGNVMCRSDTAHSGVFLGWAFNPYYSRDLALDVVKQRKAQGMKVIIVDPRVTQAVTKLADLHLSPRPGTDGALALGLAHVLIAEDMVDHEYIDRYVYGYEPYREYVRQFTPAKTQELTGVPAELVVQAARMIGRNLPMSVCESAAPVSHHENGFQNYRAIMALSAITGCFDREGGQIPVSFDFNYQAAGLPIREKEFVNEAKPPHMPPAVGSERFPLWGEFIDEAQSNDLIRQLETGKPYPIRAVVGFGYNYRIGPADERLKEALLQTDFLVNVDLFFTDTCRFCDIVLPACTSFERSELKAYSGGHIWYTTPVIEPLYQSRSDVEIICGLARALRLGDELLEAGPEACYRELIRDLPVSLEQLKQAGSPVTLPTQPYIPGTGLREGLKTQSGRFELYSLAIEKYRDRGLCPLPEYRQPPDNREFCLSTFRIPGALHSRLQGLSWSEVLNAAPAVQIHPADAAELQLKEGEEAELWTDEGSICAAVHLSQETDRGSVYLYHGFPQADVNRLLSAERLDAYSGFPAFRSQRVSVRKKKEPDDENRVRRAGR